MRMEINGLGNRTHLLEVMPINEDGCKGSDLRYFVIFFKNTCHQRSKVFSLIFLGLFYLQIS